MRFGSTANVLAKCKLKYYRISEGHTAQNLLCTMQVDSVEGDAVVNNRKNKIIVGYELHVKASWEGQLPGMHGWQASAAAI